MDKLLIIDDEKSILHMLKIAFEKENYEVDTAISAEQAFQMIEQDDHDLVLTDIRLPRKSGMDILQFVRRKKPGTPVVMITAYGTIKQAVEALKSGAADYVVKPFDMEELKLIVAKGLEKRRLTEENIRLKKELREKYRFDDMIGKSRAIQNIYNLIEKIAVSDSTVLISGESGTGKEMAARSVHAQSRRRDHPFVSVNCGALPENLLESELFGHVRGAFTGAVAHKKGMFEAAEKGTLFLDEIGELSPPTQVKLLRALQDKRVRRVGGTQEIPVDCRIISATNQDLKRKIKEGGFREDLYYRLNVISFVMPPLRERKEDIPLLVDHFLSFHCRKMDIPKKRIAPEVFTLFENYPWPGNIRELANVIERTAAIEERETLTRRSLPEELLQPQGGEADFKIEEGFNLNQTIDAVTRKYVEQALALSGGSLKKTASALGVNYRSARYLLDKFGLKEARNSPGTDAPES
ncbi:MAG: sigma-54-dependent transcriptional regulator [Candidatus Aminicenantaceae bacterium]